ncbi:hypothetical protein [Yinghuangia seranimata]|uniref:hypothetical protein n=1 Tax=Yinghuangia seranimata TaxID=408067 RepID=UPI00248B5FD8|nr:hypothetical protein [Yinghuangia seranimata]MDI2131282.1 hypothetical protein [Yinghuangia seranimata]
MDFLAAGGVVAHGFANFYAMTSRPEREAVRAMNTLKGRPADQVGSLSVPPARIASVFDWSRLPTAVTRDRVLALADLLFTRGPFGLRGPAAAHVPEHLTDPDQGMRTTQVIAPGYACPSNSFVAQALAATGCAFLAITSANRSRHRTGTAEEPAHWQAAPLRTEFTAEPGWMLLEHDDEEAARDLFPAHRPMSTTVLAFHTTTPSRDDPRPCLTVQRQGSLPLDLVRELAGQAGFSVALHPHAGTATQRSYPA